jgi:hypothetical protein
MRIIIECDKCGVRRTWDEHTDTNLEIRSPAKIECKCPHSRDWATHEVLRRSRGIIQFRVRLEAWAQDRLINPLPLRMQVPRIKG